MSTASPQMPSTTPPISEELRDKANALKSLSSIHDLLNSSEYPGYKAARVVEAIKFIESLHQQLKLEAESNPGWKELVNEQA